MGRTSTKLGLMCLAQGHNAVTLLRLQPTALQSRVKHSTTEPLGVLSPQRVSTYHTLEHQSMGVDEDSCQNLDQALLDMSASHRVGGNFNCHVSPQWRQMAIENTVFYQFLIRVCRLLIGFSIAAYPV